EVGHTERNYNVSGGYLRTRTESPRDGRLRFLFLGMAIALTPSATVRRTSSSFSASDFAGSITVTILMRLRRMVVSPRQVEPQCVALGSCRSGCDLVVVRGWG